ncbi:MAG TPA: ABC transporter substrate-binding protein, partial [Methylomirabilota bacterium]|nr:ABC transporter substrate-binding protein [Methylomirabilota bacterium]
MDRRTFLGTLTGGLLAAPLDAEEQRQPAKVARLGFLATGSLQSPETRGLIDAFRQGLRERGYLEGQNTALEYRYGDLAGLPRLANDLVRLNVAVIVAGGTPAALAAKRATDTIPIVAGAMADPVADGLVASLARPGGNVTGNTFLAPELGPKRLQLVREVAPGVTRVAALQHSGVYGERTMRDMLKEMDATAKASGLELQVLEVRGPSDFDHAFA